MIDMFSLLVSTLLTVLVVLRAIKLNRELPWFERPKPQRPPGKVEVAAPNHRGALTGTASRR